MKSRYKYKYIIDLNHLENLILSKYYRIGIYPRDTVNILVDFGTYNTDLKYVILLTVSIPTVRDISNKSRSLTMEDIMITFIDSSKLNKFYSEILMQDITKFKFKNIYERANNILGHHMKEYVCSRHKVTMTDITGDNPKPQISIDVEGLSMFAMIKLKVNKILKRPTKSNNTNLIDSFYNINL